MASSYGLDLTQAELARYDLLARIAFNMERDLWAAAGVTDGAIVADIGCGPGAVSVLLADVVGCTGLVIAVDKDVGALGMTRNSAARLGVQNVVVSQAEAGATGLAGASVDVVMLRNVLSHNGGQEETIVAHLASLLRRNGSLYVTEVEPTAFRMLPPHDDITDLERRYQSWHRQQGNDLRVSLRLSLLIAGLGLEVGEYRGQYVIVEAPPGFRLPSWAAKEKLLNTGLATPTDVDRWDNAFAELDEMRERPLLFIPIFAAFGRRL